MSRVVVEELPGDLGAGIDRMIVQPVLAVLEDPLSLFLPLRPQLRLAGPPDNAGAALGRDALAALPTAPELRALQDPVPAPARGNAGTAAWALPVLALGVVLVAVVVAAVVV